jgi:uncharacterized protein (TIGR04222 family)
MFPFNLDGPTFLFFFVPFAAALIFGVVVLRRALEGGEVPKLKSIAPYVLAYLRGGEDEAVRVAVVSLVDRGLVKADGSKIARSESADPQQVRREIEKLVLERCVTPVEAISLFGDRAAADACAEYRDELTAAGLLPDEGALSRRRILMAVFLVLFLGTAITKMVIGVQSGRPITFLVVLTVIGSVILAAAATGPRRTRRGDLFLADMQSFFGGLKERAAEIKPGGADADLVLLAGAFGLAALPAANFAYTRQLYPKVSSGSTCGSACGSSCGSSCGGGCGGGCGGCGG